MERATDWTSIPLLLDVNDIRRHFGLSRHNAYALARHLGLRIGGKRLMVPRARLQAYLEGGPDNQDEARLRRMAV